MEQFTFRIAKLSAVLALVVLCTGIATAEKNSSEKDVAAEPSACAVTSTSACVTPSTASLSRCAEYGACSLYGDLSGATGDMLDLYVKEKARDGETYADLSLPEFTAYAMDGSEVSSADLVGKPTVLVTLAGHCSHSFQTLPILKELETEYAEQGVQVVGVFVNSGDAESVASFMKAYEPNYAVLASPDDGLGETFDSRLVPTYWLVDAEGSVKQRLVGYQSKDHVVASMTSHFAQSVSTGQSAGR